VDVCVNTASGVYKKGRKLLVSETLRVELSMKAYCCHAAAMFDCWCPEVGLVREGEKERRGRRVSI